MEIFHSLEEISRQSHRTVVTVGNFDGVHLAHQELLRRVQERARENNAASVAVTFEPHPSKVLAPQKAPLLLTPLAVKQELLAKNAIGRLLILPFTRDFSLWPPEQFVEEVFVKALQAIVVVVGENFRFGHRQTGTPAVLQELGQRFNFQTEVLPRIYVRKLPVSSSQIRRLLEQGKISLANRLLSRPFSIRNRVEQGRGIGRNQTVPTLNLAPYAEQLPTAGVYVTWTRIETPSGVRSFRSVTNVGYKPTFGEHELGVETHLLEPWAGEPPNSLEVSFLYRLRDERKFDAPEHLKSQILRDVRRAEKYFARLEHFRVEAALPLRPADLFLKLADLICLVYHEARNVRHPLQEGKLLKEPKYQKLLNLAHSRDKAWRQMAGVREKAACTTSSSEMESVFQQEFCLSLEDLRKLYEKPCWKDSAYGGNKWAPICSNVRRLIKAMDSGDETQTQQLFNELLEMNHNTGKVRGKLSKLKQG